MTEDKSAQSASTWPLNKFQFQVKWDEAELIFQEVTGLDVETQEIEYRAGDSKEFSTLKMPGITKYGNVTLKKGIFKGDKTLWDKYKVNNMNVVKRSSIVINLLDETGAVAMSWTLNNAWPCKIMVTDMKSDCNEVAIETMELANEGFTIS